MPELPEVETVRRGLAPWITGQTITDAKIRRPNLRIPFPPRFCARLVGQTILVVRRQAKYILVDLSGGETLMIHLGMSGSMRTAKGATTAQPHDHVVLHLSNGVTVIYNDPRRFGFMDLFATSAAHSHKSLVTLGPEPIDIHFDGKSLKNNLAGRHTPIKQALLDQHIVAGIGNIYACEALFEAGIHPTTPAGSLGKAACDRLAQALRAVLLRAIAAGGSTLRDHQQVDGQTGYFQHEFNVYGRAGQPCRTCSCHGRHTVKVLTQGGRSSFFCPSRQKKGGKRTAGVPMT